MSMNRSKIGGIAAIVLLVPVAVFAQMRPTPPPASIFSSGGATPPPASIFSLPSRGGNFNGGANLGIAPGSNRFFGFGFGAPPPFPRRMHNGPFQGQGRFGHHRLGRNQVGGFAYSGAYPVYVPYAYGYDDYQESVLSPQSEIENGGTFQGSRRDVPEEDMRQAPTIFENRSQGPYRRDAHPMAEQQDLRYGPRYTDDRERSRREADTDQSAETSAQNQQPQAISAGNEDAPSTLLIFRDGHEQEVTNYAIMGSTLFVLSGDRTRIPVAELDVAKTTAANEKRGLAFHVPKS